MDLDQHIKKLKDPNVTIGDKYQPAMSIQTQEDADQYLEALIQNNMGWGHTREEATRIELGNIGYYTGYCSRETALRVQKLFRCCHPIFGAASNGEPTPQEAFELGKKLGKSAS